VQLTSLAESWMRQDFQCCCIPPNGVDRMAALRPRSICCQTCRYLHDFKTKEVMNNPNKAVTIKILLPSQATENVSIIDIDGSLK
jgi:hypothetical protein